MCIWLFKIIRPIEINNKCRVLGFFRYYIRYLKLSCVWIVFKFTSSMANNSYINNKEYIRNTKIGREKRKGNIEKDKDRKQRRMGKVNWTLDEALISFRLHRPRFEPLGAYLPSEIRGRRKEGEIEGERHISYFISRMTWIFLCIFKAHTKIT